MNNLDKWVDPRVRQVKAASLHAYLRGRGWKPRPSPRPQLLVFEEPPGRKGKPVVQTVPTSEEGSDYVDSVVRAITNLAVLEDRHPVEVLDDILRGQQSGTGQDSTVPSKSRQRGAV
jgi:hypothetical protein